MIFLRPASIPFFQKKIIFNKLKEGFKKLEKIILPGFQSASSS
jgi:hypothetical protein